MARNSYRLIRQNFEYDTREPSIRYKTKYVALEQMWSYEPLHHWRKFNSAWKDNTRRNKQYLRHRRN